MKSLNWPNSVGGPMIVTTELWSGEMWTYDTVEQLERLKENTYWKEKNYDDVKLLLHTTLLEILGCFDSDASSNDGYAKVEFQVKIEGDWWPMFRYIRSAQGSGCSQASDESYEIWTLTSMQPSTPNELLDLVEEVVRKYWHLEWNLTANRHYELVQWIGIRKFVEGKLL